MGDAGYRGVSAASDPRYRNKEARILKQLESKQAFPANFSTKVDLRKCNLQVMRPWIEQRVNELLGFEDDVVAEYVVGILESDDNQPHPDPRKLQVSLTGFLESSTPTFMAELWTLLISAQESVGGIPKEFVEKKKAEMRAERERDARAIREVRGTGPRGLPDRPPQGAPPSRGGGRGRGATFRDRNGNVTERSRDAGWGARAGPPPPPQEYSGARSPYVQRGQDEDRYARRLREERRDAESSRTRHVDDGGSDRYRPQNRNEEGSRLGRDGTTPIVRRRDHTRSPSPPPPRRDRQDRDPPRRTRRARSDSYSHSPPPERTRSRRTRERSYSSRSRSPTPQSLRISRCRRDDEDRYRSRRRRSSSRSRSRSVSPPRRRLPTRSVSRDSYSPPRRRASRSVSRSVSRSRSPSPSYSPAAP